MWAYEDICGCDQQQTVVEVSTEQQIVEEVTATETISSEVVDTDHSQYGQYMHRRTLGQHCHY